MTDTITVYECACGWRGLTSGRHWPSLTSTRVCKHSSRPVVYRRVDAATEAAQRAGLVRTTADIIKQAIEPEGRRVDDEADRERLIAALERIANMPDLTAATHAAVVAQGALAESSRGGERRPIEGSVSANDCGIHGSSKGGRCPVCAPGEQRPERDER